MTHPLDGPLGELARLVAASGRMLDLRCEVDRRCAKGRPFAVCYCGRVTYRSCDACGYETPAERKRRTEDLLAAWRADACAAITLRKRQAQMRRVNRVRRAKR